MAKPHGGWTQQGSPHVLMFGEQLGGQVRLGPQQGLHREAAAWGEGVCGVGSGQCHGGTLWMCRV